MSLFLMNRNSETTLSEKTDFGFCTCGMQNNRTTFTANADDLEIHES